MMTKKQREAKLQAEIDAANAQAEADAKTEADARLETEQSESTSDESTDESQDTDETKQPETPTLEEFAGLHNMTEPMVQVIAADGVVGGFSPWLMNIAANFQQTYKLGDDPTADLYRWMDLLRATVPSLPVECVAPHKRAVPDYGILVDEIFPRGNTILRGFQDIGRGFVCGEYVKMIADKDGKQVPESFKGYAKRARAAAKEQDWGQQRAESVTATANPLLIALTKSCNDIIEGAGKLDDVAELEPLRDVLLDIAVRLARQVQSQTNNVESHNMHDLHAVYMAVRDKTPPEETDEENKTEDVTDPAEQVAATG